MWQITAVILTGVHTAISIARMALYSKIFNTGQTTHKLLPTPQIIPGQASTIKSAVKTYSAVPEGQF